MRNQNGCYWLKRQAVQKNYLQSFFCLRGRLSSGNTGTRATITLVWKVVVQENRCCGDEKNNYYYWLLLISQKPLRLWSMNEITTKRKLQWDWTGKERIRPRDHLVEPEKTTCQSTATSEATKMMNCKSFWAAQKATCKRRNSNRFRRRESRITRRLRNSLCFLFGIKRQASV